MTKTKASKRKFIMGSYYMTPEHNAQIKKIAYTNGTTVAGLIRALLVYVIRKAERQALKQATK